MLDRAVQSQRREQEGEWESGERKDGLGPGPRSAPRPLPVEVLKVVRELRPEGRRPWYHRGLEVLLPRQGGREFGAAGLAHRHDAREGAPETGTGRIGLIDDGAEGSPYRQKEVNGKTEEDGEGTDGVETPVEQHPGGDPEDEQDERRGGGGTP